MNPRRILLIVVRLLAFVTITEATTIWIFWRSISTPIERHYLSAYCWSSLALVGPSTVEVRLIWKTGRHRKQQLATDDDAVGSGDETGMALSQSARDAGWKALTEGPPEQVPAELLRRDLASLAFEGQSLRDLLVLPELSAIAALCVSVGAWFLLIGFFRALIAESAWQRHLAARRESSPSPFEQCEWLARRLYSRLAELHSRANRRSTRHRTALNAAIVARAEPPRKPFSPFPIPLFGVNDGTGKVGYCWSESDEID